MKNTRKRIEKIYYEIEKLNEELKELRSNCTHSEYTIGLFSWRSGNTDTKRICYHCKTPIGNPTQRELIDYQSNNKDGVGLKIYEN